MKRLRSEARAELLHEVQYDEARRPATGRRFREAVAAAFDLIRRFPLSGTKAPADTRRSKVKGFPFTVVYRAESDDIVVFAIAPDRRQPGYWAARVR